MVFSYIKSKLLQMNQNYKNYCGAFVLNNPTNTDNEPCGLKNHLIRILTTTTSSLSIRNEVNHTIATSASTMVTPTPTTMSSTIAVGMWPQRISFGHLLVAIIVMYNIPKTSCVAMLAICSMCLRVERTPFSDRRHLVFREPYYSPNSILVSWVDAVVEDLRRDCNHLPPMDDRTFRVMSIACKLGQGMHEVLGLQRGFKIAVYDPDSKSLHGWTMAQRTRKKSLSDLKDTLNHIAGHGSSELFDQSKKMDLQASKDLEGLEWKVIVINSDIFTACSGPYYTIFILADFIDRCSDEELAFVIGHEMGHALARHLECEKVWNPLKLVLKQVIMLIALLFSSDPCPHEEEIKLEEGIKNFHGRRNEYEADHIGMMLMASAGYDPRGAPRWLSKYGFLPDDDGFLPDDDGGSHPRFHQRVAYLKNPKRMKKAMSLYGDVRSLKLIRNLIEN